MTSGEEDGNGFYAKARTLAPDLKYDSSIVISAALKRNWGCEPWKSGYERGIKFPPLAELRAPSTRSMASRNGRSQPDGARARLGCSVSDLRKKPRPFRPTRPNADSTGSLGQVGRARPPIWAG